MDDLLVDVDCTKARVEEVCLQGNFTNKFFNPWINLEVIGLPPRKPSRPFRLNSRGLAVYWAWVAYGNWAFNLAQPSGNSKLASSSASTS